MIKIFFAFLILGLSCDLFAVNLGDAKFELQLDRERTYKEGDILNATLHIWPVEDQEKKMNLKVGTFVDEVFYLAEVLSEKRSENNFDVVQVDLLLVLMKVPTDDKLKIKLGDQEYLVDLKIKAEPTQIEQPQLIMYSQESEGFGLGFWMWNFIYIIGIAALFGIYLLTKMYLRKKRQDQEKAKIQNYWATRFNTVEKRQDFEIVYGRKREWLRLVKLQTPPIVEFFRVMEDVQYKKQWNSDDEEVVKETFENIRGIFN